MKLLSGETVIWKAGRSLRGRQSAVFPSDTLRTVRPPWGSYLPRGQVRASSPAWRNSPPTTRYRSMTAIEFTIPSSSWDGVPARSTYEPVNGGATQSFMQLARPGVDGGHHPVRRVAVDLLEGAADEETVSRSREGDAVDGATRGSRRVPALDQLPGVRARSGTGRRSRVPATAGLGEPAADVEDLAVG